MALIPFDELNTPKVEVEPPEKYFSKMAISKEQKEERVETANDLMDVLLFLFALLAIEMQALEPDYDMVYRSFWLRFRDAVAKHSRMDDYQNNYVNEFTQNAFDVTRRHMEASGVGTDGRTDAGWWTSADRAMSMGENEANSVLNYEDLQKAIDKGYTTKTWVTEHDNRVRPTHKEVDGVTIPIKEYFVVGDGVMLAPHDEYNNPAECVNCRCSLKFGRDNSQTHREGSSKGIDRKASVVHWSKVNNPSYGQRISRIEHNRKIAKKIKNEAIEILRHRSGSNYLEDLTYIDSNTGESLSQTNYNVPREVKPTDEMISMLQNAPEKSIISLHNHHDNTVPSYIDVDSAKDYKYGIILCHDGSLYKYTVRDLNASFYMSAFAKIDRSSYSKEDIEIFIKEAKEAGVDIEVFK